MPARRDIPDSGSFNAWSQGFEFPNLLLALCNTGRSGELRFMSSEAEKTIVIQKGQVVFAKSSSVDDRLGPYLLRTGQIRFEHLTELSRFVSPEKRFGTVLIENGVLSPHDLVQGVVGQVRSIVLSLFQWTEAAYIFEELALEKEDITLRIPVSKLIVDGVRQVTSWRRVAGGIGSLDLVYQTSDGAEDSMHAAKLAPAVLDLIAELRGPKTISEACAVSELSDFEICQLLWAFSALDWVSPITEQTSSTHVAPPASEAIPVVEANPAVEAMPIVEAVPVPSHAADAPKVVDAATVPDEIEDETDDLEGIGMILKNKPLG